MTQGDMPLYAAPCWCNMHSGCVSRNHLKQFRVSYNTMGHLKFPPQLRLLFGTSMPCASCIHSPSTLVQSH